MNSCHYSDEVQRQKDNEKDGGTEGEGMFYTIKNAGFKITQH